MEGEKVETELEFQMTKGELAEYCVNVTVKGIWSQKLYVAVFGMLLLAGVGEGMLMAVMGKGLGYLGGAVFCWCLFAGGILAVSCILLYWQCSRLGFLKPRAYKVEKGYLCCKNDKSRIPCSWYTYRAETPRVLILGRPAARKNYVFLAVPKRMFPDRETMDRFLDQFTNPQAVEDDGHVAEGIFNFYFFMDHRAWSHAWIQGMQMGLRVKKLYGAKKGKVFRVTGIVAALCGMSIGMIADSAILTAVFLTMLLLSYMRGHGLSESFYKKQMMSGWMPSDGIGRWEISIGVNGIRMKRGLAFTEYSWEDYNCLAETEDTFFFLNTETGRGIECIPVPKWVFKDLGEMDAFLNFCRDKGVKWAGLDSTADLPKNDRMLYILIFMVLLAVVISGIIRAVYL